MLAVGLEAREARVELVDAAVDGGGGAGLAKVVAHPKHVAHHHLAAG